MAKSGLEYQQLVAEIESAFDPGAEVQVGEWVEGPDGNRDCDVSVRGAHDGHDYVVFIECKDHRRPVGISIVDGLDSVRRDLKPDVVILYSNSGFTSPAIQKARRVGIVPMVAVAGGDNRSRAKVETLVYGGLLTPSNLIEQVIEPSGQDLSMPEGITVDNFMYRGGLVHNWVAVQTSRAMEVHADELAGGSHTMGIEFHFSDVVTLMANGQPIPAAGLRIWVDVDATWMAKNLPMSVDLGRFDQLMSLLYIPANTSIDIYGLNDQDWEAVNAPPADDCPHEEGIIRMSLYAKLQAPIDLADGPIADLNPQVALANVVVEPRQA